jgi:hypothetical protein
VLTLTLDEFNKHDFLAPALLTALLRVEILEVDCQFSDLGDFVSLQL